MLTTQMENLKALTIKGIKPTLDLVSSKILVSIVNKTISMSEFLSILTIWIDRKTPQQRRLTISSAQTRPIIQQLVVSCAKLVNPLSNSLLISWCLEELKTISIKISITIIWGDQVRLLLEKRTLSVETPIKPWQATLQRKRIRVPTLPRILQQLDIQETELIRDVSRTYVPWATIWCALPAKTVQKILLC